MKARKLIVAIVTPVLAASLFVGLIANAAAPSRRAAAGASENAAPDDEASRRIATDGIFGRTEDWVLLDANGQHEYRATVEGWTIFTMQVNGDDRLQMSIFTSGGRLLGTATSEGCGIMLQSIHPMDVTVLIENDNNVDVDYVLHIN